jgi:radical SAM-linked protein
MGTWVRLRFRKTGDLRWIGHLDLMRTLERLFRRAGVAIALTEGFHPHPRLHFPASLALGAVGENEVLEVDLTEAIPLDELLTRLNAQCAPGLNFTSAEWLPSSGKRSQARRLHYRVALPAERVLNFAAAAEKLMAESACLIERDDKSLDIRPQLDELNVTGNTLSMVFRVVPQAAAKPRDVLQTLGAAPNELAEWELVRTDVELADAKPTPSSVPTAPPGDTALSAPPVPSESFAEHRKHLPA